MAAAGRNKHSRNNHGLAELRALLGRVRSRGFKVDDRTRAFAYRTGLQRVLMKARLGTQKSPPAVFFETLNTLTRVDVPRFLKQPIGHDFLLQLLEGEAMSLEHEIRWISARLNSESDAIAAYLDYARDIEQLFIEENYDSCLSQLGACESSLGVSLWSTELKLGLTQAAKGLDAQKAVLKDIRAIQRKGMWPYVANAASVRAEPSVSISWFIEETRRRQERLKQNDFSDYLRYRGLGTWPETKAACARILRTEQSHHIIDVYETFVSYLQEASTRKLSTKLWETISNELVELRGVDDIRLRKLDFAINGYVDDRIPVYELNLLDSILDSKSPATTTSNLRAEFKRPTSTEQVISLAATVRRTTLKNDEDPRLGVLAIRGIAEALRRRGYQSLPAGRADEKLKKSVSVFGAFPLSRSVGLLLEASTAPYTDSAVKRLKLAALNSGQWGLVDLLGFAGHKHYGSLRSLFNNGPATDFADVYAGNGDRGSGFLRADASALAKATQLFLASKPDDSTVQITKALASKDRVIAAQSAVVALNAYARTGDVSAASQLIAEEHVDNGVSPESMPVREIYQDLDWRDLRDAAIRPQLSIALSLIQSSEGDDKLKTYRRFALETLLKTFEITKPSELRTVVSGWPHSILVYFLEHVCTTAMLDMLPSIRSSREVLEERRDICGYLATIDKLGAERHQEEVLEISRELTVLDGLRTIDGSRVHVDVESLSKRLKVDLAESFQRYLSLLKNSDESVEGISAILKDIGKREQQPDYLLAMPVSETDELLVSMIMRSRERFLFDVPHGLDSYISKRIRHGSIVGVVRAPAEREGVVAKRNLDGSYRSGGTWADTLVDGAAKSALVAAITSTSKAIDQHLIRLKDNLLHVRSEAKTLGLFDIQLTPPSYFVIRSYASSDATLDGFVDTMIKSLWAMLAPSLSRAQDLLRRDSINFVSEQFQALRVKAQRILKDPGERTAFDATVVAASVGVQAALATAASWFEPADSVSRTYSLQDIVDIAVESVRATTTGFAPELEVSSNSDYSFSDLALPLVCDVLYIAFGNVAAHSGVRNTPKIWLTVDRDDSGDRLNFCIENEIEIASDLEFAQLEAKLDVLRQEIRASRGAAKARSEGGSGLHKLASIVSQTDGDALQFSSTKNRFNLRFNLTYSSENPF